jgi:hypothetical protein
MQTAQELTPVVLYTLQALAAEPTRRFWIMPVNWCWRWLIWNCVSCLIVIIGWCRPQLNAAAMIVADMNLPSDSIQLLMNEAVLNNKPLVIVAVSQPKMARLPASLKGVRLLILNQAELEQRLATKLTDTRAIIEACATAGARCD